jgi:hypothetical protein
MQPANLRSRKDLDKIITATFLALLEWFLIGLVIFNVLISISKLIEIVAY